MKSPNFRSNRVVAVAGLAAAALIGLSPVHAETPDAVRTGDIYVGDDSLVKLNELYPGLSPPKQASVGKTRAQVQRELREAIRTGDIYVGDDSLVKLKEMFPGLYPRGV